MPDLDTQILDPKDEHSGTDNEQDVTPLELSDEDFFKLEAPSEEESVDQDDDDDTDKKSDEDDDSDEELDDDKTKVDDEDEDEDNSDTEDEDEDDEKNLDLKSDDDDSDLDQKKKPDPADADDDKKKKKKIKVDADDNEIDYKVEYEKLIAPFKANGTEMAIKNTDDAIRLMQMGANYQKKMIGLKPVLKTVKLLEKNGLMDEKKLNYLIDLNNQDPAAITKLLKDSQLDPMDINVKDDSSYKPTNRSVSDAEVELDQVLEEIQDTPTYSKTLNIVTKEWDETSKTAVAQQPHIISVINAHVEAGIYDKVMGAVNYERNLGNLRGISDFDAYKQMGDTLHAAGKLGTPAPSKPGKVPIKLEHDTEKDKKRKKRKKAVQPNRSAPSTTPATFNPLDLSDDDFEKLDLNKLMSSTNSK